ncbi:138aa long hypothetical protein [Pyrococcus horikoshii OT3]|uniref:Uncharacterized protein n=1 Tax=Pyrococcus horikoshii (strain ATCC 700860 / DSM 12428 / JCM 9974 / NBRC 100139 / OT-3) TaxID=70601 RepID=O58341_PYRHO|nr:138aa long hypothetical protein [Pyrococcus horikoshii OT3]
MLKIAEAVEKKIIKENRAPADLLAFSKFPAPMYCPTIEKPAIVKPIPRAIKVPIIGQETPGADKAALPSFPSQKVSVMLYSTCIKLLIIIGQANLKRVPSIGPSKISFLIILAFSILIPLSSSSSSPLRTIKIQLMPQ